MLTRNKRQRKDLEKQALSHLDLLYFVALKLTGRREDAEDLVQETYHKAFTNLDQLRDVEKCKPWLYSIMINTWKNWKATRSREFYPENLEQWEASEGQYADGIHQVHQKDPEADLLNKEVWAIVESALAHLPSDYRMAIILSDIEGFSYKEISEMMEWPIGTVMSRLSRARSVLRRILRKYKEGK
jgi:RNA polymerase sigma-70 factor (ECF subfamily)